MPEPAAVPTLSEIQSTLSKDGTQQPPDFTAQALRETGPGLVIGEPETEVEKEEAPEAASEALNRRVDELEDDLARANKRQQDSAKGYYQATNSEQIAQGVIQSMNVQREREAQAMQALQAAQPPPPVDVDMWAEDPNRSAEYARKLAQWSMATTLAALNPSFQKLNATQARLDSLAVVGKAQSFDRAQQSVSDMGFDDFEEFREDLENRFLHYGPEGQDMMMDPEKVVNGYLMLRRSKGLSMRAPGGSEAPDSLPDQPSVQQTTSKTRTDLNPMANQISRLLQLDGGLKVTEDDLERVGL